MYSNEDHYFKSVFFRRKWQKKLKITWEVVFSFDLPALNQRHLTAHCASLEDYNGIMNKSHRRWDWILCCAKQSQYRFHMFRYPVQALEQTTAVVGSKKSTQLSEKPSIYRECLNALFTRNDNNLGVSRDTGFWPCFYYLNTHLTLGPITFILSGVCGTFSPQGYIAGRLRDGPSLLLLCEVIYTLSYTAFTYNTMCLQGIGPSHVVQCLRSFKHHITCSYSGLTPATRSVCTTLDIGLTSPFENTFEVNHLQSPR